MLVEKWMTKKLITIEDSAALAEAIHLLKQHNIRRLPVMHKGKMTGIVSDRDLKEASPSKATSLDIWELHYLLQKVKIKDVMTPKPITIGPKDTIERAAMILMERKIGALPVVSASGELIGILSEHDVFNALVNMTGVHLKKTRVSVLIPDKPGTIKEVADIVRSKDGKIFSILTSYVQVPKGMRELIMRVECADEKGLREEIEKRFDNDPVVTKD
jgi:acetoin utilization protein AcuB